ncbi:MAG: hypothetical protein CMJ88_14380 [Planctomycetes bacterium]|nr:hypothetical protein [Planctomycetota bacterium]
MLRSSTICSLGFIFVACGVGDPGRRVTHEVQPLQARRPASEEFSGALESLKWRRLAMLDENGQMDPLGMTRARSERKVNVDFAETTDGAGIGNLSWTERGPDNIGGRSRALIIHPTITSRMYAAGVGGGVWRSDDSGASWYPLADFMGNLSVCSLAFDPSNPNRIYAGTGEGYGNIDAIRGEGIWTSVDGGATWAQLPSTAAWQRANRIAVNPIVPSTIFAATNQGLRRSTDGGATWTTVQSGNSYQVLIDPTNANRMVCHYLTAQTHRIAFSTDSGVTWADSAGGFSTATRIEMAFATSVSGRIYASVDGGDVWRSDDAGANWTMRSSGQISSGQWWYNNAVWVDPTNSSWLLIGAQDLFRSSDGGQTFTKIGDGGANQQTPHSDVHAFTAHPDYNGTTNRIVYTCTDGGVYRASDIRTATTSSGWSRLDNQFRTVQYYGVAGHSSGRLVGGTQDNGSHMIEFGDQFAELYIGGDGANSQIDPGDPDYIWGSYQWSRIHRSTDGGQTGAQIVTGLAEVGAAGGGNFIAPLVSSRFNPNVLYAGALSLWRCSNAKGSTPSWTSIKSPIGSAISAIAVSPNSSNTVWVGHNNGRIFRTSNALGSNPSWTEVDLSNQIPNSTITRILIDRSTTSEVLIARAGFNSTNLWRTTDAGVSFTDVTGAGATALPSAPLRGIAQHPSLAGRYYVATEVGVFGTSDDCQTWSGSNDGPADVACYDITFLHGSNTLLVGTHGRGMWTTEINEPQATSFGVGCPGSNGVPVLTASDPRIGIGCTITGSNMPANGNVWIVQGLSRSTWNGAPLPFDLTPFQAPGCSLRVRPDIVRDGFTDGAGNYVATMPIAANTALIGMRFYMQAFPGDPTVNMFGRTASNGVDLLIGN